MNLADYIATIVVAMVIYYVWRKSNKAEAVKYHPPVHDINYQDEKMIKLGEEFDEVMKIEKINTIPLVDDETCDETYKKEEEM